MKKKRGVLKASVAIPPLRTRAEQSVDAIIKTYLSRFMQDLEDPLQQLEDVYDKSVKAGPRPKQIQKAWLAWKHRGLSKGLCIKNIRLLGAGKMYVEFDPEAAPRTVAREFGKYLEMLRTLQNWKESGYENLPQNPGARSAHPINRQDFIQDVLIVMARNAGWSHGDTARKLRRIPELDWPSQGIAVNRLKKRVSILREALGSRLVP